MTEHTIVIGGGVGGMVAALRARRHGASVQLVEARDRLGGLASSVAAGGTTFDGGPYILLDQDRLRWALDRVGVDLDTLDLVVRSTLPTRSTEQRGGRWPSTPTSTGRPRS